MAMMAAPSNAKLKSKHVTFARLGFINKINANAAMPIIHPQKIPFSIYSKKIPRAKAKKKKVMGLRKKIPP